MEILALACASVLSTVVLAQEPQAPAAETRPSQPPFDLMELRVLGNSVLDARTIESALLPHLGPAKTLGDVEEARTALENVYHARGYGTVFVDIPEQTIGDDGVVRLRVTEAQLRRARITGTRYFSNRQIRNDIPAAAPGVVPNLPELQAQIAEVNAVSLDRSLVPVLKAGAIPGTVDLEMKVQDELPLHASVEVNDQYTSDTSRLRTLASLRYDNAFNRQDSAILQYQFSPQEPGEVDVLAASYVARLSNGPGSVDTLTLTFIDSSSDVATLDSINVLGQGKVYSLGYTHPLAFTPEYQSALSLTLDFKRSMQNVNLGPDDALKTPVDYTSLQAAYNFSHSGATRRWSLSTVLGIGFSGLGSSEQEFADKCYRCRPNFSVLRMQGAFTQNLPGGLSVSLLGAGQYSVSPLISDEQIFLGGAHSVRGYLEAEELGDIGIRGSVELRMVSLFPGHERIRLQPFAFFDAGMVRFQEPLPGQPASAVLRSAGIGLDIRAGGFLDMNLYLSEPLVDGSHTKSGDERFGFLMRTSW